MCVQVRSLPNVLAINTGLDNERDLQYLKSITGHACAIPTQILSDNNTNETSPTSFALRSGNGITKQCRYGISCSRIDCHFAHPERSNFT